MTDSFFLDLDSGTLSALLAHTEMHEAALIIVGPSLHIENCNKPAAQLTGLHPLERIDQLLSEPAVCALRDCIARHVSRTVQEELDGVEYRLELIPHRTGALLAFVRAGRARYDGSLRVLQAKTAPILGAMLADATRTDDPVLAQHLRRQCLRLHRMLLHSDFLHDPPLTEQLQLDQCEITALCREAAEQTAQVSGWEIALDLPESCTALVDPKLIGTALYNLLTNAVRATPPEGDVTLSLRDEQTHLTITVADRGAGLNAELFDRLLSGWQRTVDLREYLDFTRRGAPLGFGLPLTQCIAQLHGGTLLFSPRAGGGSMLHFIISHLPESLAEHNLAAPMVLDDGFPLAEIELSCLDPQ
ncbi:MAG: sensor histidine kinase [Agathobaculum sp.]|jgi:signal transduction histidine kinase|uniref:sensor histidine kinase n=1 Tax=Agathobaculum sp. TaxID=2048138 RepID=UPI003D90FAC7